MSQVRIFPSLANNFIVALSEANMSVARHTYSTRSQSRDASAERDDDTNGSPTETATEETSAVVNESVAREPTVHQNRDTNAPVSGNGETSEAHQWLQLGKDIGLEGRELLDFIKEQQAIALENKARQNALEREREREKREREERERERNERERERQF